MEGIITLNDFKKMLGIMLDSEDKKIKAQGIKIAKKTLFYTCNKKHKSSYVLNQIGCSICCATTHNAKGISALRILTGVE